MAISAIEIKKGKTFYVGRLNTKDWTLDLNEEAYDAVIDGGKAAEEIQKMKDNLDVVLKFNGQTIRTRQQALNL